MSENISLLFPKGESGFKPLSAAACHDLGIDTLCKELTDKPKEQKLMMNILSSVSADEYTAGYRHEVFTDILHLPDVRKRMTELFDRIEFLRYIDSFRYVKGRIVVVDGRSYEIVTGIVTRILILLVVFFLFLTVTAPVSFSSVAAVLTACNKTAGHCCKYK